MAIPYVKRWCIRDYKALCEDPKYIPQRLEHILTYGQLSIFCGPMKQGNTFNQAMTIVLVYYM